MAYSSTSKDVAVGVMNAFRAAADYGTVIPGGVHLARPPTNPPPAMPYGVLEIFKGSQAPIYSTGDSYIDFRRATITYYGPFDKLAECMGFTDSVLSRKTLTIPNATFMACTPLPPAPLVQKDEFVIVDEATEGGEDVFAATCDFDVITTRTVQ